MMVAGPVRRARVAVKKGRLWSRAPAKIFWAQFHISGITSYELEILNVGRYKPVAIYL